MNSSPRSILITGASSGIGEALALHYAGAGISLALTGRNAERLEAVANACREHGAEVHCWAGDVTDADGLRAFIEASDQRHPLNLVIANAGVGLGAANVEGLHRAAVDSMAINVEGVFNTVHPAIERMALRRPYPIENGQIALLSSVMGFVGMARSPAYSTSKATVKHYGEALRGALRGMGIRVSVICPGYVGTPMTAGITSPKPFEVGVDEAARMIARGLARNRGRITFPWQMTVLTRLALLLPGFLVDRLNRPWGVARLEDQH